MTEENADKTSRRAFLANLLMGGGLVVGAGTFLRNVWQFLYPDIGQRQFTKFMVAKVEDLPVGKARKLEIGNVPIHVVHLAEGFKVYSGICTHLGCLVKWEENKNRFYCPCHKGIFASDGKVLSGPPPRPLDEYKVTIQNELVFIEVEKRKGRWS